jgi:cytochrome c biogenesis protein CcdA
MNPLFVDIFSALWLGILTSISPCPLSTNIAAISYVGRKVGKPRYVLMAGLLYTAGRSLAYLIVAVIVTKGLLSIPGVSMFLQRNLNLYTGPLMLLLGIVLLDIWKFSLKGGSISDRVQSKVDSMGIWGAALLGILFALAFCPVSAGLFFGGLIPVAMKNNASAVMAVLYGIGTALPVMLFALLLAFAANRVGMVFRKITAIELWARRVTAVILILVGLYLILKYNFRIYLGF